MDKEVFISLAIVTYNNVAIIENTISNILSAIPDEYSYKFYIIDNNSSDGTAEVLKKFGNDVEIIQTGCNKGFGYAHNRVLSVLNSKYHFVINPDINIEDKEQLKKMIDFMDVNNEIGMLSPLVINNGGEIQYLCKRNPTVFDMTIRRIPANFFSKRRDRFVMKDEDEGYSKVKKVEFGTGCFMMLRTKEFLDLKGFDDRFFMYFEDADITRRINLRSKAVFFPFARVVHNWQMEGHKSWFLRWITVKSMFAYFNKWGWRLF